MKAWVFGGAVGVAMIASACAESGPLSGPSASRSATDVAVARAEALALTIPQAQVAQGLLREQPLKSAVTVTKVIPNSGGSIDVPGTDFQLRIPRGAFVGPSMTFSVTALPGSAVAYNFEPHGTVFLQPLTFAQKLGHTNLKGIQLPPGFQASLGGAYFSDASFVDPLTGVAVVNELLPANITATVNGDELSFPIWHFSGYMASTGRSQQ